LAPRWASPPGETIRRVLAGRGQTAAHLAKRMGWSNTAVEDLLSGRGSITIETARRLSETVGASPEFWMARDAQYRDDLARVANDEWVQRLPFPDMVRMGWVPPTVDWRERIDVCARFFGVDGSPEWSSRYGAVLGEARFRASAAFDGTPEAVTAWLRQAETLAAPQETEAWNAGALRRALPALTRLSRQPDPRLFLPELRALLATAGIAVVIVRAPRAAPVSGAVWRAPTGQRLMALSARHLADDHFWFTVLHECGHLLLHSADAVFVDRIDHGTAAAESEGAEAEANRFAADALLPALAQSGLPRPVGSRDVLRLSGAYGVSPGVVVGLLQHDGIVEFRQFNHLKRRYRWDGDELAAK
jgi:addiction module HigA family antidote